MQTAEQSILERISISRGATEPEQSAPTENTEAVNVSEDAPVEEVITEEAQVNEEVATETDEPAEAETEQATDDDESEDLYVEYQGREINLKDVYKKEQEQMMQADYTRKTQGHAEDVKTFNAEKEEFNAKQVSFDEKMAQVDAILKDEILTAEQLDEMWEYEPEKVKAYQERQARLVAFVDSNKSTKQESSFNVESERKALWDANPTWLQDGKQTKAFETDMAAIQGYASNNGYSDFSKFKANDFQMMLKASKYDALNNKNAAIEKKVRKAPVITKPRALSKGIDTAVDKAQKAFNKNPSVQNAAALRTAKRQLNT